MGLSCDFLHVSDINAFSSVRCPGQYCFSECSEGGGDLSLQRLIRFITSEPVSRLVPAV